jgi:CubicO group peptidase (beta-lactamase class C family)
MPPLVQYPKIGIALCAMLLPSISVAQTISRDQVTAALPRLEEMINKVIRNGEVPGLSIAVVHGDEVVYLKGFGVREAGKPDTVGADTVVQIASLSKAVSSTVVAALVGEGVTSWDAKIASLDPSFRLADPYPTSEVTIRDLFSHRSGLPGTAGDDLEDIGYDRAEILRRLRLVPASSSFRAGYSYSNFGLTEGAVAAVKPTERAWEDVAEEKLYRPLGMMATSSRHADFLTRTDRAALHIKADGAWTAKLQRDPDAQAPAGGVSSTVRDLAQWLRLELGNGMYGGKRLIAADALDQTHVPLMTRGNNPVTGAASFYGLGWNVEFGRYGLTWGHAGAFSLGARTVATLFPKAGLGIVVLTNAFPTGIPEAVSDSFADLVFDGEIKQDWVAPWNGAYSGLFGPAIAAAKTTYSASSSSTTPPLESTAYEGRFSNAFAGDAVVANENGNLILKIGPARIGAYIMRHFDRDLFLTYPDAEMPDKPSAVRFSIGPDGRASAINIEMLDGNGLGTLQRVP